jgi:hypothetical protein
MYHVPRKKSNAVRDYFGGKRIRRREGLRNGGTICPEKYPGRPPSRLQIAFFSENRLENRSVWIYILS